LKDLDVDTPLDDAPHSASSEVLKVLRCYRWRIFL